MELAYSTKPANEAKAAKAIGRDLNISFKDAVVVCDHIRGKKLEAAINMMEETVNLKNPVPYKKFNKGIGHRKGDHKVKTSRYPTKIASEILKMLANLQSNAEYKGLDVEKLRITHIQAQKGLTRMRRKPKGRWKMWARQLVSIQAIAEEK